MLHRFGWLVKRSPDGSEFGLTIIELRIFEPLFEAFPSVISSAALANAVTAKHGGSAVALSRFDDLSPRYALFGLRSLPASQSA